MIELDELKRNNELHGHQAGDDQLRAAGRMVRTILGDHHFGARLSGDRIGVLMVGMSEAEVSQIELALRHAFAEADISINIGLSRRHHETGLEGAVAEAEDHLEEAHTTRYAPTTDLTEVSALEQAIELGAITAYFQPIVDLRTGAVVAEPGAKPSS